MFPIFTKNLKIHINMILFMYGILILMGIALIVLIIKEHLDYKKEFETSAKRKYNSRLKNEIDLSEE